MLGVSLVLFSSRAAEIPRELRVGAAGHAFEHLGGIGEQADAAAASGATIIYPAGFGQMAGYDGIATTGELKKAREKFSEYNRSAKANGIQLAIAYVCATSIVKLETFDRNWTDEFRAGFSTPLAQWLQQDRDGKPLPSWYGGDYRPACMNNPDWRTYEKNAVRMQLESGHEGIFFDNPTVHPQGCYCEHCMKKFAGFLKNEGVKINLPATNSLWFLRELAVSRPKDFLRFRSITARDFLGEMRSYAHTIKPRAFITCNNSLNSPDVFYSQSRTMGYNIYEMSKTEDWVTVEDMATQPRVLADGRVLEYGPTYELVHAISHGKPVVVCTIAEGDYHTAPNLVRLAMAEAAAHNASYLSWPTWPTNERPRMIETIRPQADLLRANEKLLNETRARRDVVVFLPFRRWMETDNCVAGNLAAELSRANIPFEVICEDDFDLANLKPAKSRWPVLLVESLSVFNEKEKATLKKFEQSGGQVIAADQNTNFIAEAKRLNPPSLELTAPKTVRAVVREQSKRTMVHLLNLNIHRLSSFQDKVQPAENVRVTCRVPFKSVRSVRA
ncbi:MAG: hypothetical protein ACR2H1_14315, partial [Limisphaerales bacterium]